MILQNIAEGFEDLVQNLHVLNKVNALFYVFCVSDIGHTMPVPLRWN